MSANTGKANKRALDTYIQVLRDINKYPDKAYSGPRGSQLTPVATNCGTYISPLSLLEPHQYPRSVLSLDAAKRVLLVNVFEETRFDPAGNVQTLPGFQYICPNIDCDLAKADHWPTIITGIFEDGTLSACIACLRKKRQNCTIEGLMIPLYKFKGQEFNQAKLSRAVEEIDLDKYIKASKAQVE
ncbi:uncharacterized protein LOC62_01G000175 [Vanrija pseudolonga]|uniref:Uncharacterized protein n=1 Tax=Vanrija pseudolonga TaxID=143232 RepID=A0AAF0XZ02_9TREE|nr:hypothetical protein LOC62_01G000175 [Vanrija pseudolonga]